MNARWFDNYIAGMLCKDIENNEEIVFITSMLLSIRQAGHSAISLCKKDGLITINKDMDFFAKEFEDNVLVSEKDLVKLEALLNRNGAVNEICDSGLIHIDKDTQFISLIGDYRVEEKIIKLIVEHSKQVYAEDKYDSLSKSTVSILTGGPGSGKTYTCSVLIKKLLKENVNMTIAVVAPTGKAVDVIKYAIYECIEIADVKNVYFGTVHSIFKIQSIVKNDDTSIQRIGHDFIIIDESSMLSNILCLQILRSIKSTAKIIFVGDYNQLPAVSFGSIFYALCKNAKLNVNRVFLKGNMRAKNKTIVDLSESIMNSASVIPCINECKYQECVNELNKCIESLDLHRWLVFDASNCREQLEQLLNSSTDFKFLTVCNTGLFGTDYINNIIMQKLKVQASVSNAIGYVFIGISTVNQKAIGLSNGSHVVTMHFLDKSRQCISIYMSQGEKKTVSTNYIRNIAPAWAITIHKSQGSSYKHVYLFVGAVHTCTKIHLYTAITRAQKNVTIYIFSLEQQGCALKKILEKSGIRYSPAIYM